MSLTLARWRRLLFALAAATSACAISEPVRVEKTIAVGAYRVTVSVPEGWEVLDQGTQKRFRQGDSEVILQDLGKTDLDAALGRLKGDQRREVKSRTPMTIREHEAVDIETWNRLDHMWPQRFLFVRLDDQWLALHTPRLADAATMKAFEAIRDSLQFVVSERR
jgi:hypothetical protein